MLIFGLFSSIKKRKSKKSKFCFLEIVNNVENYVQNNFQHNSYFFGKSLQAFSHFLKACRKLRFLRKMAAKWPKKIIFPKQKILSEKLPLEVSVLSISNKCPPGISARSSQLFSKTALRIFPKLHMNLGTHKGLNVTTPFF